MVRREATRSVGQLSQAEVYDVVPAGGSFRVSTRVLGGVTTHQLRRASIEAPSARDVIEYRRGFLRSPRYQPMLLPYGRQEITVNLAAAGALYKKLCEASEGYASAVPVIHQAVAVKAAIDALEMAFEEDRNANF